MAKKIFYSRTKKGNDKLTAYIPTKKVSRKLNAIKKSNGKLMVIDTKIMTMSENQFNKFSKPIIKKVGNSPRYKR